MNEIRCLHTLSSQVKETLYNIFIDCFSGTHLTLRNSVIVVCGIGVTNHLLSTVGTAPTTIELLILDVSAGDNLCTLVTDQETTDTKDEVWGTKIQGHVTSWNNCTAQEIQASLG